MAAATPLPLAYPSQQAIIEYHKQCYTLLNIQWNLREQLRMRDLNYMRENDYTNEQLKAKNSNVYGDPTKYQNITVPVIMPQVEAAVTYQASVFLTQEPIFGIVAPPGQEDQALQLQSILEENSIRGGWKREFIMFFRDLFKYNLAAIEVDWGREVTAALDTDVSFALGQEGKPKEIIWEGNTIKRWDLYNTFWDTRVKPNELFTKGEFVGNTELLSRIQLKVLINRLPDKIISNIKAAFESGPGFVGTPGLGGIESYYIPILNPTALMQIDPKRSFDWVSWAGIANAPQNNNIAYKNLYEVTTMYARILPSDFNMNVPAKNTPQVWKFIIVNHQVLIYAERCTNAHAFLPVIFGQANDDGLGYQTKSLADNALPFQSVSTALLNSVIAARRRAISDRTLYDPSRIAAAQINSDNPSAKIPVRPAAYGSNISEAVYAFPFRDDQSGVALQEIPQILAMADKVNGLNQAKQGQFTKGNRTGQEYRDIMSNANGRDQLTSLVIEDQIMTPIKQILKLNTLQFQAGVSLFTPRSQKVITIDPVALRQSAVQFTVTDGLIPADKIINGEDFSLALQTIGSSQQIGAGYNIAPMFSYIMKTRNLDLKPFEKTAEQQAYEQALAAWQQTILQLAKQMGDQIDPSKFPPQPIPQQYNYVPGQLNTGAPTQSQSTPQSGPTA